MIYDTTIKVKKKCYTLYGFVLLFSTYRTETGRNQECPAYMPMGTAIRRLLPRSVLCGLICFIFDVVSILSHIISFPFVLEISATLAESHLEFFLHHSGTKKLHNCAFNLHNTIFTVDAAMSREMRHYISIFAIQQ